MLASFVTTFFVTAFEEPTHSYFSSFVYVSPLSVAQDLITAALRILKDGDVVGLFDEGVISKTSRRRGTATADTFIPSEPKPRSFLMNFIRRFILGLPMVGAGSLVHMLLSAPLLGPLHWLARQRGGGRRRRDQSRDIAAMVIVALLVVGAARFVPASRIRPFYFILNPLFNEKGLCTKSFVSLNRPRNGYFLELKMLF